MTRAGFHAAASVLGAAALFWAQPGRAASPVSVEVAGPPCAQTVHVKARDARLDEVVTGIAQALKVRLEMKAALSERITLDRSGPAEEVLTRLMQNRNLVLDSTPRKSCAGSEQLSTIWVLPAGQDAAHGSSEHQATIQQAGEAPLAPAPGGRPKGMRKRYGQEGREKVREDLRAGKIVVDPSTGELVNPDGTPANYPKVESKPPAKPDDEAPAKP